MRKSRSFYTMTDLHETGPYNVVRFYRAHPSGARRRMVEQHVTLARAQAHCANPETSSSTCKGAEARRRTRRVGDWFDGYEER